MQVGLDLHCGPGSSHQDRCKRCWVVIHAQQQPQDGGYSQALFSQLVDSGPLVLQFLEGGVHQLVSQCNYSEACVRVLTLSQRFTDCSTNKAKLDLLQFAELNPLYHTIAEVDGKLGSCMYCWCILYVVVSGADRNMTVPSSSECRSSRLCVIHTRTTTNIPAREQCLKPRAQGWGGDAMRRSTTPVETHLQA